MARAFNWANALADHLEVGPVSAALVADQLETTPAEVLAGALGIAGAYRNPATGFVVLPRHVRCVTLGTTLSDLTYVVGNAADFHDVKARLRARWGRGNFALPRDLGRRLTAWKALSKRTT